MPRFPQNHTHVLASFTNPRAASLTWRCQRTGRGGVCGDWVRLQLRRYTRLSCPRSPYVGTELATSHSRRVGVRSGPRCAASAAAARAFRLRCLRVATGGFDRAGPPSVFLAQAAARRCAVGTPAAPLCPRVVEPYRLRERPPRGPGRAAAHSDTWFMRGVSHEWIGDRQRTAPGSRSGSPAVGARGSPPGSARAHRCCGLVRPCSAQGEANWVVSLAASACQPVFSPPGGTRRSAIAERPRLATYRTARAATRVRMAGPGGGRRCAHRHPPAPTCLMVVLDAAHHRGVHTAVTVGAMPHAHASALHAPQGSRRCRAPRSERSIGRGRWAGAVHGAGPADG